MFLSGEINKKCGERALLYAFSYTECSTVVGDSSYAVTPKTSSEKEGVFHIAPPHSESQCAIRYRAQEREVTTVFAVEECFPTVTGGVGTTRCMLDV